MQALPLARGNRAHRPAAAQAAVDAEVDGGGLAGNDVVDAGHRAGRDELAGAQGRPLPRATRQRQRERNQRAAGQCLDRTSPTLWPSMKPAQPSSGSGNGHASRESSVRGMLGIVAEIADDNTRSGVR
jgi:hypothetical protein